MKNARSKDFTRDTLKLKVSFSLFDGMLASERVAEAAATAEHADQNRIVGKVIAIPRAMQKDVFAAKGMLERIWKSQTRPWEDGGWRLCWAEEYAGLRAKLDDAKREFRDAVQKSIAQNYTALKAAAEKELNGLLGDKFPSKEALMARYDIRIFTDKIASNEDLRFSGLSESEVETIVKARNESMAAMISEGNADMVRDIQKAAETLHATLSDPEKGFKGCPELGFPLVENLRSMLDRAEKWNITDDQKLAAMIAKARKALDEIKLDNCKTDKAERKAMAKKSATLLDELASF